jgi:predicted ArsR family transcriptional regulator
MPNDSIVTTEADTLINLLSIKGEMSLEEASKELGIPIKTVEDYANFFEEEGLVTINYKFTTPYLSLKEKEEKVPDIDFSLDEPEKKAHPVIDNIKEQINIIKLRTKSGEYHLLRDVYPSYLDKIKEAIGKLNISKETKSFEERIKELEKEYDNADLSLGEKDVSKAKFQFEELEKNTEDLFKNVQKYQFKNLIPEKMQNESEIKELLSKAYDMIKAGDFDEVKTLYQTIQQKYILMPDEYRNRMDMLKGELISLNQELTQKVKEKYSVDVRQGEEKINHLIEDALKQLEEKQLEESIKIFNKIKDIYYSLPDGFVQQKIVLNEKILETYNTINLKRKEILEERFDSISRKIASKIEKIKIALDKEEFNLSIQDYNYAVALFDTLPDVKKSIKKNIKNYLILVFEKLSAGRQEFFNKFLKQELHNIDELIRDARVLVNQNNLDKAKSKYDELIGIYKSLPEGYTQEIAVTQQRIFQLFKEFSDKLEVESKNKFHSEKAKIENFLKKLKENIHTKKNEETLQQYERIMVMFNEMPRGFLNEKANLQNEILLVYNEIIKELDNVILKGVGRDIKDNYHNLLKTMVMFDMHLETREFKLVSVDYRHLRTLMEKLPYGIIKTSKLIQREFYKISIEVSILNLVKKLETALLKSNAKDAKKCWVNIQERLKALEKNKFNLIPIKRIIDISLSFVEDRVKGITKVLLNDSSFPIISPPGKKMVTREELKNSLNDAIKSLKPSNKEVKKIKPLTKDEEKSLREISKAKEVKTENIRKEFDQLQKILKKDIIESLYSSKKTTVIKNKINLARSLISIKKLDRAKDLLREVKQLDPDNKRAESLLRSLK